MPEPSNLALPWVESPFFEELLPQRGLSSELEEKARFFHENGYLVLEDAFPEAVLEQIRQEVTPLFAPDFQDPRKSEGRFQDAWKESSAVRSVATDTSVAGLLEALYGRKAVPFQTLNFRTGTEQRGHSDTIHFSSVPARFMCGVWVALEPVDERNGTLFYYPGSHRLPQYDFTALQLRMINPSRPGSREGLTYKDYDRYEDFIENLMAAHGLERKTLNARPGTALIWASGLVHGGSPIGEVGSSRWSQVTHYYFEDCLYYAPILSNAVTGDIYLKKIVDIRSGTEAPQSFQGLPLPEFPDDDIYKLFLDFEKDADTLRWISNDQLHNVLREVERLRGVDQENAALKGEVELLEVFEREAQRLRGVDEENAALRSEVGRLEALIQAVERSLSFRLGRAITAPFRFLAGLSGSGG